MNNELDEATAIALATAIHNHIEALKVWERKVRAPYMPTTRSHLSVAPDYPKPTLNTIIHIAVSSSTFRAEVTSLGQRAAKEEA